MAFPHPCCHVVPAAGYELNWLIRKQRVLLGDQPFDQVGRDVNFRGWSTHPIDFTANGVPR